MNPNQYCREDTELLAGYLRKGPPHHVRIRKPSLGGFLEPVVPASAPPAIENRGHHKLTLIVTACYGWVQREDKLRASNLGVSGLRSLNGGTSIGVTLRKVPSVDGSIVAILCGDSVCQDLHHSASSGIVGRAREGHRFLPVRVHGPCLRR